MNAKFLVLTSDFALINVANAVTNNEAEIVIREDVLQYLSVTQLVQIAKSMNSELKVNNKQAREIILTAINEELVKLPVVEVAKVKNTISSKEICYAAFDELDMNDKPKVREVIETLIVTHNIPKRVVQSYASNYRKANKA